MPGAQHALSTLWFEKILKKYSNEYFHKLITFAKKVLALLVLFDAWTENSATSVLRNMTKEDLRDLINLFHEPPEWRQHCEEIAEHGVWNYTNWCSDYDSSAHWLWPWPSYFTSLILHFFSYNLGKIKPNVQEFCGNVVRWLLKGRRQCLGRTKRGLGKKGILLLLKTFIIWLS